ncbi:MAG: hypothetical protein WCA32_06780 [Chromatiaceae bacterium]
MRHGRTVDSMELPVIAAASGLIDGRVVRRFNCFYDTTAEARSPRTSSSSL